MLYAISDVKQIEVTFSCVSSVIDREFRYFVVKVAVNHRVDQFSITRLTHEKLTFICFVQ